MLLIKSKHNIMLFIYSFPFHSGFFIKPLNTRVYSEKYNLILFFIFISLFNHLIGINILIA